MFLSEQELQTFETNGFLVIKNAFDPIKTVDPVFKEYELVLNNLAEDLFDKGEISSKFLDQSFDKRMESIAKETQKTHAQYFDFSLPIASEITEQTPMWHGPQVFNMLTFPGLLDIVESVIGSEIYSNPVQHVRIRPPSRVFTNPETKNGSPGHFAPNPGDPTAWHQDQTVGTDGDLDDTDMLTVWIPIRDTTEKMGCLKVVPGSHKQGVFENCGPNSKYGKINGPGIPERFFSAEDMVPLPVNRGDVIIFHRKTIHGSLVNESDKVRISFDIRYHPIGQSTGRHWFPGFVARSQNKPESVLADSQEWSTIWKNTRTQIAEMEINPVKEWIDTKSKKLNENPFCA